MNKIFMSHKSIRKYKPDPINDTLLDEILVSGSRASTTGNMQVYSIIVNRDPATKEKLWEVHFRQNMVLEAPVHLTFCADFNRFNIWCRMRKADPGFDNFLSFFTAAIDALLVSQNVCLAAEEKGLGVCYLGTATYNADRIIEILNLPDGVVPVAAIVMGYPAEDPGITPRLPMEAVVHYEKYKNFTPEIINEIYMERESSDQTKELLSINEMETLPQIFTAKRYTRKDNEYYSKRFLKAIKRQGF